MDQQPTPQSMIAGPPNRRLALNIRQSVLLAFALMCAATTAVGTYSSSMIRQAAGLVANSFNRSLISVDYARATGADFTSMQNGFLRQHLTDDAALASELTTRAQERAQRFHMHLAVSLQRAQSPQARTAIATVQHAAQAWQALAEAAPRAVSGAFLLKLDNQGEAVQRAIEALINITIADGLAFRAEALRAIQIKTEIDVAATLAGLLLSGAIAWYLHRHIAGPVAQAAGIAVRIAAGDLDVAIPVGRDDELGHLLAAMAQMRDSIAAMMRAEIGQRRSAQARLMDAVETMQEGVVLVDAAGQIVLTNATVESFFGTTGAPAKPIADIADLVRHLASDRITDASRQTIGALLWPLAPDRPGTAELALTGGVFLRVSWCATREGGLVAFFSDVTEPRLREAQLATTNLWFDAALSQMSQGLCVYDSDGVLQIFNARFCEIYHLQREQLSSGMQLSAVMALLQAVAPEDKATAHDSRIGTMKYFTVTKNLADGRVIEMSHRPVSDGGWVLTYEDITARTRSDARIAFMAGHDALTQLPNRSLFTEQLSHAIEKLQPAGGVAGEIFGLLLIDLDRFKEVNDTKGHPVGDRLLRVVAERLLSCARQEDTVARLGGDEFAIVQRNLEQTENALELAERIISAMGSPFLIEGNRIEIGASIGIALAPEHGTTQEILLRSADTALYRAKEEGRSNAKLFTPSMEMALQDRRTLEQDLQSADLDAEMELLYQPIYDIQMRDTHGLGRITGFEALLRWNHPTNGLLLPGEFIAASENTGFIERLGGWILQRACEDAVHWPHDVKVTVNVSPLQFRSNRLAPNLREALASTGLPAKNFELEITESALLQENELTLDTLRQIKALGVKIALDDFGTGYASLSYLRSFPFDRIKIDASFVKDLGVENDASAIIRTIIGLGRSLHIPVTAEGVETPEQLALLRAEGCAQAQGFLFSRPVAADQVAGVVERAEEVRKEGLLF